VPAAATTSAAAAPLAALGAVAHNLTLLASRLAAGALLASRCWRCSARDRLPGGTRIDIPLAPLLIPLVVAPIAVTIITAASLSVGAPAITLTAPLTAL
jgi:hypothetical protein